jgi:hypothetical protein
MAATTRCPIRNSLQQSCRIDPTKLLSSAGGPQKMDNAILNFAGFHRFGLAFDRKSNDLLQQISIAELVAHGSVQRAFCNVPASVEATAMTAGPGAAVAPHTLLSITRGCRQNLKPATRTATNAGMSDIEEAVRAILKACAELSAAQAALDHKTDATTAPRDYAVTKVHRGVQSVRGRRPGGKEAACDQDHSHPTIRLSRRLRIMSL